MSSEAIRGNLEAIRCHLELGQLMREAIIGHQRQTQVIKRQSEVILSSAT
jgi:hypothetical protein